MSGWQTVVIAPTLESWREAARDLLARRVEPGQVLWEEIGQPQSTLFNEEPADFFPATCPLPLGDSQIPPTITSSNPLPQSVDSPMLKVSREFMDMARAVAAHRDDRRWSVLYGLVWRMQQGERQVLEKATDPAVRLARSWQKAIGRDIHKMHAFVRFRLVGEEAGRECFAAWFEPEHRILRLATPFFLKRFAGMNWSLLTPEECAHWDGERLSFSPGVPQENAPDGDALETLWRSYYRSIFNPARVKVKAMQSEMPKKYWAHLPEAADIAGLIQESAPRVQQMLETPGRPPKLPHHSSMGAKDSEAG
jgi:probable DNA metabolism protein